MQDLYQSFIHKSRYARYLPDKKRRENWNETVNRYLDFMEVHLKEKHNYELGELKSELFNAIYNKEIMPSMRCMMTAGPALARDNTAGFNCSYVVVDDVKAFDESMYILLCGTGVGFSVERQYINQLPEVPEKMFESGTVIDVRDSKAGWAKALRQLLALLYSGEIPKWDTSKVRPAGSRLKVFGGRASGPGPLEELFRFVVMIFKHAQGRKLTSLECHDIMCKIGDAVVVGGVRRSAMISLSNLSDDRMRNAKSGEWWKFNPQRTLSNNSAVYTEKPEVGMFMKEWLSLYESKSGERGIFNRQAAKRKAAENGRRDANFDFGTNPCISKDMVITTSKGSKLVEELIDVPFHAIIDGEKFYCEKGFFKTGTKQLYKVTTIHGYNFKATDNHLVLLSNGEWREVGDLEIGDTLTVGDTRGNDFEINQQEADLGWIVGEVVGDGCYCNGEKYKGLVRFWGETSEYMADKAFEIIESIDTDYNQPVKPKAPVYNKINNTHQITSKKIDTLCTTYLNPDKTLKKCIESTSISFMSGFIRGMFDSDGTVGGDSKTGGLYLQLTQSNLETLQIIQRMLINFGILSKIHKMNNKRQSYLPDGKGGHKVYPVQQSYRLDIGRDNIDLFSIYIGFNDPNKSKRLNDLIVAKIRKSYESNFMSQIVSIEEDEIEDVYDCTVEEVHAFICNGIVVHNCSEIILRPNQFCNLAEVVVRSTDTIKSLHAKIRLATILGTFQSTLTYFPYLRKIWIKNTEEERLLGVSLTGILDNKLLNNYEDKKLPSLLETLRETAIHTNKEMAELLQISASTAITCVKPSGTVSQLVNSASGIHPRHSQHYIRRVRGDVKDPLVQSMKDSGFMWEPDNLRPYDISVFSFPQKAPEGSVTRQDLTPIEHLKLWLVYQRHWCEHKPSITVSVKESDWPTVGAWVWENFNELSGVSFLPESDHIYEQPPYEEITKEKYDEALKKLPTEFDWDAVIEDDDNVEGAQMLACVSATCEL